MNVTLASRTLIAFDHAVRADQGARYRGFLKQVLPHINDAYSQKEDGFRTHLGASLIGRECSRELWYNFRWVYKEEFSGQMLRLFNRGHLEEGRFISLMLASNIQVYQQDAAGKQYRISEYGGHFGGSGDGVGIGFPDLPEGHPALTEFKTHNDASFKKLAGANWAKFAKRLVDPNLPSEAFEGDGVRSAKFEHWVQMQIYMRKMGLACAIYFAVNKNDDHIYAEIVNLDSVAADKFIARAGQIIPIHVPPKKINESPGWWGCNFCSYKPVCKQGAKTEVNCRTCQYSEPNMETGAWHCIYPLMPRVLSKDDQKAACGQYEKLTSL